ncbi:MAG: hypothetical protein A4E45_01506 [Methanosaeta sp. PtaB.Bin039]|nr:MAG: hypothetical protein A4E45_01506 [Methanosaeta sp. PtaB.Bin039]
MGPAFIGILLQVSSSPELFFPQGHKIDLNTGDFG